jgi:putative oxidoreductase
VEKLGGMDAIQLVGRLVFVAMFLSSGIAHFKNREGMTAYARSSGAPAPGLLVPASGAMILVGGVLVALGVWPDVGVLLIAAFLLPVAYFMHAFWKIDDPQMRQQQQVHFMKNLSLFGAALVMFACFADGHTGLALGGSLF